jgi:hypothetical protein
MNCSIWRDDKMIGEEKNFAPVNGKLLKLQQQKKQRVLVVQINRILHNLCCFKVTH